MSTIRKAMGILTPRERTTGAWVVALSVVKGLMDTLGVAVIVPFLTLISDPNVVLKEGWFARAYDYFGFTSPRSFVIAAGIMVIVILILGSVIRAVSVYAINRWAALREYSLSRRLIETYLRQPYRFFVERNSSDLSTYILSECSNVVGNFYLPAMSTVSAAATTLFISILLLLVDPVITIVATLTLGGSYLTFYLGVRPLLQRLGVALIESNRQRFRIAKETLGSIKQMKLLGREAEYLDQYSTPTLIWARRKAFSNSLRQVPRFGLEAIVFSGIIAFALVLVLRNQDLSKAAMADALPTLGLVAFAGMRLMPSLQQLYAGTAGMRFGRASVEAIHGDMKGRDALEKLPRRQPEALTLRNRLVLENVSYNYAGSDRGLRDINLTIERGTTIGVVGTTGAGKTTLIDLILGLLTPTSGAVTIDGNPLTDENRRAWQATLGYVPQEVYLQDATVLQNIAMGVKPEDIDHERVIEAAKLARIHDFVVEEMDQGYDTPVGDLGIRLSGGQRQRIGIARALYTDPSVIVLDEATSALDNATERAVLDEMSQLFGARTTIMIAHRLSSVRLCDKIVVLELGRIVGLGTYDALARENVYFESQVNQA